MNKTRTLIAAALIGFSCVGQSAVANESVGRGMGVTDDSCGNWIADRAKAARGESRVGEALALSWVLGYMSGMNMNDGRKMVNLPNADTVRAYLDKACREDPLTPLVFQVMKLMDEARRRAP